MDFYRQTSRSRIRICQTAFAFPDRLDNRKLVESLETAFWRSCHQGSNRDDAFVHFSDMPWKFPRQMLSALSLTPCNNRLPSSFPCVVFSLGCQEAFPPILTVLSAIPQCKPMGCSEAVPQKSGYRTNVVRGLTFVLKLRSIVSRLSESPVS